MQRQIELPLKHFPYQPWLEFKRVKRRALAKAIAVQGWVQLELKMIFRKLVKAGEAFTVHVFGNEYRLPTLKHIARKTTAFFLRMIG